MSRTAMVIDDSRTIRTMATKALERLGFSVAEAADGEAALAHLATAGAVDIILVDWHMEKLDGCGFLGRLREVPEFRRIPVIMITVEATRDAVLTAARAGACAYIRKPFEKGIIEAKVREIVDLDEG